jgi:hypothetical protein
VLLTVDSGFLGCLVITSFEKDLKMFQQKEKGYKKTDIVHCSGRIASDYNLEQSIKYALPLTILN